VARLFPSGQARIFNSDGSSAGGTWDVLDITAVDGAFGDGSIPAAKLSVGSGTEGQVIKIVSGVPTFADESGTGASPVTSSVSGTVGAFTASQRRIFHSDGSTAGGVWTQLSATDVTGAFAAASIGAGILTPGTNGQVLTTSGGVATWSTPAAATLVGTATAGVANLFPSGSRRVFHSDGTTAGGTWDQLSALDVTGAFAPGAIGATILTPGTNGQVLTTSSGVTTWATPSVTPAVSASVAGTASAFTASQRRIFHSDGTTSGGLWTQLAEVDVTGAFAAGSIASTILKPGTNGQILTTSGGVATWAAPAAIPFVSGSVAGTAAVFPAGSRRIFHSDGSTAGGVWTQLSATDVSGAFADLSIAVGKLTAGTDGYQLTTVAGAPTWTAPEFAITGAVNGDIIRRASGAWQRYAITSTANAPLMSINNLPAWSPHNVAPTLNLGTGPTLTGFVCNMATYGDNRVVFLTSANSVALNSISDFGFRHGAYAFINSGDFNITINPDSSSSFCGFITPTGAPIVLEPGYAMLAHYYGEGSLRDLFVMQVFDAAGEAELPLPGSTGELLYHNGSKWVRLAPAANTDYKLMSGGPVGSPYWKQDDDGSTVVLSLGYVGSARNIFGSWADAFAAAKAHGGPARIYVEDTGSTVTIPGQVWDGEGRIGIYLANRTSSSSTQLSIASGGEIQNITELMAVTVHPFDTFPVNIEVLGTSTNSAGVYLGDSRGLTFKYSGKFNWTGARTYSVRVRNNHTVHMQELVHAGQGMHSNSDLLLVVQNQVTPPAMTSDSGTAILRVRQLAGTPAVAFTWAGSGGIIITKADDAKSLSYTPADSTHWHEGAPDEPSDALDKLAARNRGAMPPGVNLAHNKWWFFGKNTEGLDFNPATEGTAVWVPKYNHWLYFGFLSSISETDHRSLGCGGSHKGMHNLLHQGWWEFQSGSDLISSNFKRPLSVVVIPNGSGVRVIVSAALVASNSQCVATSDDGGDTWTMRTGHFGTTLFGYSGGMVFTGTHVIGITASSNSTVGRSTVGTTWSSVSVSTATRIKLVTDGNGTVIALTATGAIDRSGNHGASWTTSSIPGMAALHDAIWFDGKFIVMSTSGTVWTSADGITWSSATPFVIENPGKSGFVPFGSAYRSIVKCGGVLYGLFRGEYDTFTSGSIFYSLDGITWRESGVVTAFGVDAVDGTANRFSNHLASSSMNGIGSLDTDVHQIAGRLVGTQFQDFDTANNFFISPAVLSNTVY
jgi:hypothetical protein